MDVTSRNQNTTSQFIFRVGSMLADERAFMVKCGNNEVVAQPLVLETLFYLLHHAHRLVTKDELLLGPWRGACVTEGAVHRCIMLVRRLLAEAYSGAKIETVRGRGFRLVGVFAVHAADGSLVRHGLQPAG